MKAKFKYCAGKLVVELNPESYEDEVLLGIFADQEDSGKKIYNFGSVRTSEGDFVKKMEIGFK